MQHNAVYLLFCKFTVMFRVSTTPIIRSTHNCNYSLRYYRIPVQHVTLSDVSDVLRFCVTRRMTSTGGCSYSFVCS